MNTFAIVSVAITICFIWFMPKRLSKQEIYITWGIMAALTLIIDLIFGLVYDLYDFATPNVTLIDIFLQAALPPSIGVIFLNFMPEKRSRFIPYLLLVTLSSVIFEWLCIMFKYLVYKGWSIWFSAIFYFLGMIYLRWHLFFIRRR